MKTGDIFYWTSDQAAGYLSRNKFHIYIGPGNWKYQDQVFLFVNKSNAHGDSYRVTNPPYRCFPLHESFVNCGGIIPYSQLALDKLTVPRLGTLSTAHLQELRRAIADSETMAEDAIQLVCSLLDQHLSKAVVKRSG